MDQDFQTSFIPKKPMIEERASSSSVSLFTIVSIFIFASIILASGGLYFYKRILEKNIIKMEDDLNLAQARFEPSKILQLQVLDNRLIASNEILSKHIVVSPIFKVLQEVTLKNISYTKFSYDFNDSSKNNKVAISMTGIAKGYQSIALQSDIFAKYKYLIDPVFSNLLLDDKGNVIFDLDFSVDSNFVDYKKVVDSTNDNSSGIVPDNGGM